MDIRNKTPDYTLEFDTGSVPVREYDAVVVGSGAAGFGCALSLYACGVTNIAIVTEGRNMGTSRNTGSDKQTYYKLSETDDLYSMARDMMSGGSMHGDLALVEASSSTRGFHRLTALGVPFPHNEYGRYVGYRTDHDTAGRATSCGPLTSKYMTEYLERDATVKNIPFYDGRRAVSIIVKNGRAAGILTVSDSGPEAFCAPSVVWATGGPSAVYMSTVYPESQTCALGTPMLAGARGINLTESQYGLASVSPRWNVSGSYQQVIPRYVSTDENGDDEREFLADYISEPSDLLAAVFKKGYEWPFSASKIYADGHYLSSAVDMAVFSETLRGRRVFLDFTREPSQLLDCGRTNLSLAGGEAFDYLRKCGCKGNTPIERLSEMNEPAIELYASRGVDLYREKLEIAVCAQHCNGGIEVDKWYETRTPGLFVIGEAAGVFGVQRPGGSALNSTQVGGIRAAEMISSRNVSPVRLLPSDIAPQMRVGRGERRVSLADVMSRRAHFASMMTGCCSFLRKRDEIAAMLGEVKAELSSFNEYGTADMRVLRELCINRDIFITQAAMLSSALCYIDDGGASRGSYLITDKTAADVLASRTTPSGDTAHRESVLTASLTDENGDFECGFEPVRPIPTTDDWFENVYRDYRTGNIYKK